MEKLSYRNLSAKSSRHNQLHTQLLAIWPANWTPNQLAKRLISYPHTNLCYYPQTNHRMQRVTMDQEVPRCYGTGRLATATHEAKCLPTPWQAQARIPLFPHPRTWLHVGRNSPQDVFLAQRWMFCANDFHSWYAEHDIVLHGTAQLFKVQYMTKPDSSTDKTGPK
jgi:hypothetical protein